MTVLPILPSTTSLRPATKVALQDKVLKTLTTKGSKVLVREERMRALQRYPYG